MGIHLADSEGLNSILPSGSRFLFSNKIIHDLSAQINQRGKIFKILFLTLIPRSFLCYGVGVFIWSLHFIGARDGLHQVDTYEAICILRTVQTTVNGLDDWV
jgi:hypothetical protein